VDQPPFLLACHGIFVSLAEETDIVGVLESFEIRGIPLGFPKVQLDRAPVLLATLDEDLLPGSLRLKSRAGQFHVQGDCNQGRHQEH
jgi:hypothetical protein